MLTVFGGKRDTPSLLISNKKLFCILPCLQSSTTTTTTLTVTTYFHGHTCERAEGITNKFTQKAVFFIQVMVE